MEGSWWKSRNELDEKQEAVIMLPLDGKYIVTGPPGCGKTNLLVLRAAYLTKAGLKNLKILTFGTALSDFVRTGVEGKGLDPGQVDRHVRWGRAIAVGANPDCKDVLDGIAKLDDRRHAIAEECKKVQSQAGPGARLHQVILVDEVQDLFADELDVIVGASDRIMLAGDSRQRVYRGGNAVQRANQLGFTQHQLAMHYRMGHAIAKVADRIFEPDHPSHSLSATCNYDETKMKSSAELLELKDRDEQFSRLSGKLKNQLKAYPKEIIGILAAKKSAVNDLRARFAGTELEQHVVFHDEDSEGFGGSGRIHVMTIVAAKGTEFRAVHLYACEEISNVQDNQTLWYTAVTRAKTSLTAYASPGDRPLSRILMAGFAEDSQLPNLDSLFDE